MKKPIYFDYAAATPMSEDVQRAMEPYLSDKFYNPSASYLAARSVRQALEAARASVARQLGARPAEIIFTSGATESNNLAVRGVMAAHPGSNLIVSAIEHDSVLAPAQGLGGKLVPVDNHGMIKPEQLKRLINDKTVLVSVIMVSNELGTLQSLTDIAQLIKKIRLERRRSGNETPLYLHTDAAQAANYFELNVARLGVDLLTINGAKLYGPKQTGALYVRAGTRLVPQITGGGQEFGLRAGTENVAGAIGLAKAFEVAAAIRKAEVSRLTGLRGTFIGLINDKLPQVMINGHPKKTSPHIVSLLLPGRDAERLMMELDEKGVQAAVGSACSASDESPSHVLMAIGLTEVDARSCLRFSFGRQTTEAEILEAVKKLADLT